MTSGYGQTNLVDIFRLHGVFLAAITQKREQAASLDHAASGPIALDALITAPDAFPDDQVIASNAQMLFAAGRITSEKAIAEGIRFLLQNPDRWEHLRTEATGNARLPELLAEEWLRPVTPTSHIGRWATVDVDLCSQFPGEQHKISQGQKVLLFLEAGNYDPAAFSEPDRFDPLRRANKHIAFGFGAHTCPGASLARLELRQVARALLQWPATLRPIQGVEPLYHSNPNLGGLRSYRVEVHESNVPISRRPVL